MEGSGFILIRIIIQHFPVRTGENQENPSTKTVGVIAEIQTGRLPCIGHDSAPVM